MPTGFKLFQNYPNPFSAGGGSAYGGNPGTEISYRLTTFTHVTLRVYDILGREVATLVNSDKQAGNYKVEFPAEVGYAHSGNVSDLPEGIYFYAMDAGGYRTVKKMILLK